MDRRFPKTIDMTPEGEFRSPMATPAISWPARVGLVALGVSLVTGLVASLALLAYLALLLLPIAIGAGLVAYLALRLQFRRGRRASSEKRFVFRP